MDKLKDPGAGRDGAGDVLMNQSWMHEERLAEEPDPSVGIRESDERHATVAEGQLPAVLRKAPGQHAALACCVDLPGDALAELGIAMLPVMEGFKAHQLGRQMFRIPEALTAVKELVVDVVEPLHDAIAPGFRFGDEHELHAERQAEADKQAQTAGIPVRAAKRQLVIDLKAARNAEPATVESVA